MSVKTQKETFQYQTAVKQLLHLVTHSLYSNKEIFLRELCAAMFCFHLFHDIYYLLSRWSVRMVNTSLIVGMASPACVLTIIPILTSYWGK